MRIKKIRAKNFREALTLVKKELGKDAVILSSDDKKGISPYVEVTAAVDYDIQEVKDRYQAAGAGNALNSSLNAGVSVDVGSGGFAELQQEIRSLRHSIESMKNSGFELKLPEERKKMFYFLKEKSIRDEFALSLVERAGDAGDLEALMSDDIRVMPPSRGAVSDSVRILTRPGGRVLMLVGPTGVGKTTTIAKLASKEIREGKKVALISIDTYKVGAAEQIRIFARMIGIPLDIVSNMENLKNSIYKYLDRDLLLIDTTGHNPRDNDYIEELKKVYSTGLPIETQLLLSTSSDSDFLMNTHRHYRSLPIDCLAFTKTDEAVKLGPIYNLCRVYQKPVAYITTGQKVPGNIEFMDSRNLSNLILRTGSA